MANYDNPWTGKPVGDRETRIMVIEPSSEPNAPIVLSLKVVSLDSAPLTDNVQEDEESKISYNALSYAWGTPEDTKEVTCDAHTIAVTANLHAALRRVREKIGQSGFYSESGLYSQSSFYGNLWADQICIDQYNIQEKNAQVAMMGEIFQNARLLLIWLGEASEAQSKRLVDSVDSRNTLEEQKEVLVPITHLPWFKRRWGFKRL